MAARGQLTGFSGPELRGGRLALRKREERGNDTSVIARVELSG